MTNIAKAILLLFFFHIVSIIPGITSNCSALPSFPGAEGGGAATAGGRGGQIIEVTNLNKTGSGSFLAACATPGPRIVIFRVGGTIDMEGQEIFIENPYITIAGQTAPGGGILIKGGSLRISTHDVIIRYIRLRLGADIADKDNLTLTDGSRNIMIDHCSFSWGTDENIGVWSSDNPARNITLSWNIIAEGLVGYFGLLVGCDTDTEHMADIDVHHNLFMHNSERNPKVGIKRSRVINNIIYNYNWGGIVFGSGIDIDIIGNIIKDGVDTSVTNPRYMVSYDSATGPAGDPSIYIVSNIGHGFTDPQSDNWGMIQGQENINRATSERHSPLTPQDYPITITDVLELEAMILSDVGASKRIDQYGNWVSNRDTVDERLVREYSTGTGHVVDHENQVGGYPTISSGPHYLDADGDGMADVWEERNGLNPNDPSDGSKYSTDGTYTNIEKYLYGIKSGSSRLILNILPVIISNQKDK